MSEVKKSLKQVPEVDFIRAVIAHDTLEAAGVALKDIRGEVVKPASMYQRYAKMRKEGKQLPDRPTHTPKVRVMSNDEANALIAEALKAKAESKESAE